MILAAVVFAVALPVAVGIWVCVRDERRLQHDHRFGRGEPCGPRCPHHWES